MGIGIHVSLWTPEWDSPFEQYIEKAADLGFDAVEIPIMNPSTFPLASVRDVLRKTGLQVYCGTGISPDKDVSCSDRRIRELGKKHLADCLAIASEIGSPSLQGVIHSSWGLQSPVQEVNREASAAVLKETARQAADSGMIISLECINRYESSFLNTVDQGLHMLELIDEKNVGLHLDTYHMNIEENDIPAAVKKAGSRLTHLHLSENQRGFPGSGYLDWESIIPAVKDSGYSGPWIIESYIYPQFATGPDVSIWRDIEVDPEQSLERSLSMLRDLIG